MVRKSVLQFDRPRLFSPEFTRNVIEVGGAVIRKTLKDVADTNIDSTASFRYDPPSLGIRSTQQIPVDFSKFENHTFFNSAEVNVNVAFHRIIQQFPFDGTRREVEEFVDSLTGFEKYVYDSFPKNKGYLFFSGSTTAEPDEGSYIQVNDFAGTSFPDISRKNDGKSVLDPGRNSFTIEVQLFVPDQENDNQIICQKMSGSAQGMTLGLSQSVSTTNCDLFFSVVSGSHTLVTSASIQKGRFNHVAAIFDRTPGVNNLQLFDASTLVASSSNIDEIGELDFKLSPFVIGSGTLHSATVGATDETVFTPQQTFSGALDELRVFHTVRTAREQQLFANKAIFASPDLKLYFKFNEPTGSFGPDDMVLDSSGESLHSQISNFDVSLRLTSSVDGPTDGQGRFPPTNPMTFEKFSISPVLFPGYTDLRELNTELLATASLYDQVNPNLITRLVPNHYFQEGQAFEGLGTEEGTITDPITSMGSPGVDQLGSSQLVSAFLYVWAKFFDELKMVIDLFSNVLHVDYDEDGTTADQFLPFLARYYGFDLPAFFTDSSLEQFIDAENIDDVISTNDLTLQYVQNQLWRRIFINIGDVIRSKGTLHSIRSLFRSMGIDPDNSFRIREFGGPTTRVLTGSRENRSAITTLLDFSGSLATQTATTTVDTNTGFPDNKPLLRSSFLSGSRLSPGFPEPQGSFVFTPVPGFDPNAGQTLSNDPDDGLFTSGSWTYEALYRYPSLLTGSHATSQSLARMFVTGTSSPSSNGGLVSNLTALSGTKNITLYINPGLGGSPNRTLVLPLTGADIFDGKAWNVSFGRERNDAISSFASSSYFLRAARQDFGRIVEEYTTSSFFFEPGPTPSAANNVFQAVSSTWNASGSFIVIGSQSIEQDTAFLNNPSNADHDIRARSTEFGGRVGQVRFWSHALSVPEWEEHVRNFRSLGVADPLTNFNFTPSISGSFERLRFDAASEQDVTQSNTLGEIRIQDFSQNDLHMTGTGFEPSVNVLKPERVFFSQISPRFDEAVSNDKVRPRSFIEYENARQFGTDIAPVFEIPRNEMPNDDVRFSIDFSIVDALNEDIIKIFGVLDALDNALGNPELVFSPDYPDLENMRDVYFNRLTDSINFKRFFEFFKWLDSILRISLLIEQLIPRKTRFLGTNFVIESHLLERPKFEHLNNSIYLAESNRHGLKGTILLQQFVGLLRRF